MHVVRNQVCAGIVSLRGSHVVVVVVVVLDNVIVGAFSKQLPIVIGIVTLAECYVVQAGLHLTITILILSGGGRNLLLENRQTLIEQGITGKLNIISLVYEL